MSNEKAIRELRMLFETRLRQTARTACYGTVEAVDEQARTCSVRVGGIVYEEVLLNALSDGSLPGTVAVPRTGSAVVIARVEAGNRYYAALFSEIEKYTCSIGEEFELVCEREQVTVNAKQIVFNGGDKGMVHLEPLVDKINELVRVFNSHTHVVDKITVKGNSETMSNVDPIDVPAPVSKQQTIARPEDIGQTKIKH